MELTTAFIGMGNMRKKSKHKPIQTSVPMLVNRLVHENVETLEENIIILAFRSGFATKDHYDNLVKMANMMNIANQSKPCELAKSIGNGLNVITKSILNRYNKLGKFGLNGAEFLALKMSVKAYDEYWKRQTTNLYNLCVAELNAFYADIAESRAA